MEYRLDVTVADGKYTLRQKMEGGCEALRYGEPWPAFEHEEPDNLHLALAYAVQEERYLVAKLEAENSELRAKLFPYADATEISGVSWDGKYLIGDKDSIKFFHEMKNRGEQIDVYKRAYDEKVDALTADNQDLRSGEYLLSVIDQREKLRAALRPFAESLESTDGDERDGSPIWETPCAMAIDFKHLRAAAAAIATTEGAQ